MATTPTDSTRIRDLPHASVPPTSADFVIVESLTEGTKISTIDNLKFTSDNFVNDVISGIKINPDIAGNGLTKSPGTSGINVAVDNITTEIGVLSAGTVVRIKDQGVTGQKIADNSVPLSKIQSVSSDATKPVPSAADSVVLIDNGTSAAVKTTVTQLATVIAGAFPGGTITSNTTLNVGTGQTYATIQDAYNFLSDKRITSSALVTINLVTQVHSMSATVNLNHPDGERIAIQGQPLIPIPIIAVNSTNNNIAPNKPGQIVSSVGSNTAGYSVTFQLQPGGTSGLNIGDYIGVEFYNPNRASALQWWHNENNNNNSYIWQTEDGSVFNPGDRLMLQYGVGSPQTAGVVTVTSAPTGQGKVYTNVSSASLGFGRIEGNRDGEPVTYGGNSTSTTRPTRLFVLNNEADAVRGSFLLTNGSNSVTWTPAPGAPYNDLRNCLNVGDTLTGNGVTMKVVSIDSATTFKIAYTPVLVGTGVGTTTTLGNGMVCDVNPACVNGFVPITSIDTINNRITVLYNTKFAASQASTYKYGPYDDLTNSNDLNNAFQGPGGYFPVVGFRVRAWKFPTLIKASISTGDQILFSGQGVGLVQNIGFISDVSGYATATNSYAFRYNSPVYIGSQSNQITLNGVAVNGYGLINANRGPKIWFDYLPTDVASNLIGGATWITNSASTPITLSDTILEGSQGLYINGCWASMGINLDNGSTVRKFRNPTYPKNLTVHGVYGFNGQGPAGDGIRIWNGSKLLADNYLRSDGAVYISHVGSCGVRGANNSVISVPGAIISNVGFNFINTWFCTVDLTRTILSGAVRGNEWGVNGNGGFFAANCANISNGGSGVLMFGQARFGGKIFLSCFARDGFNASSGSEMELYMTQTSFINGQTYIAVTGGCIQAQNSENIFSNGRYFYADAGGVLRADNSYIAWGKEFAYVINNSVLALYMSSGGSPILPTAVSNLGTLTSNPIAQAYNSSMMTISHSPNLSGRTVPPINTSSTDLSRINS